MICKQKNPPQGGFFLSYKTHRISVGAGGA